MLRTVEYIRALPLRSLFPLSSLQVSVDVKDLGSVERHMKNIHVSKTQDSNRKDLGLDPRVCFLTSGKGSITFGKF
jgi:hypothetical protein